MPRQDRNDPDSDPSQTPSTCSSSRCTRPQHGGKRILCSRRRKSRALVPAAKLRQDCGDLQRFRLCTKSVRAQCRLQLLLPRQQCCMFQWDMASTTISLHLRCRILTDTVYKWIDQQQSNSLPRMACKTNAKYHLSTNYLFLRDMANTTIFPCAALF